MTQREKIEEMVATFAQDCESFGANPEQWGSAPEVAQLVTQIETLITETELKKDIKYLTLKARYQRMFLGGESDALVTKRQKKRLMDRLATLTNKEGE